MLGELLDEEPDPLSSHEFIALNSDIKKSTENSIYHPEK